MENLHCTHSFKQNYANYKERLCVLVAFLRIRFVHFLVDVANFITVSFVVLGAVRWTSGQTQQACILTARKAAGVGRQCVIES